jgi:hypothetical protein
MGEDLAERVDVLICAWDNVVETELNTVVMILLGRKEKPFRYLSTLDIFLLNQAGLDLEV